MNEEERMRVEIGEEQKMNEEERMSEEIGEEQRLNEEERMNEERKMEVERNEKLREEERMKWERQRKEEEKMREDRGTTEKEAQWKEREKEESRLREDTAGEMERPGEENRVGEEERVREVERVGEEERVREVERAGEEERVGEEERTDEEERAGEVERAGEKKRVREVERGEEETAGKLEMAGEEEKVREMERAGGQERAEEEERVREMERAGEEERVREMERAGEEEKVEEEERVREMERAGEEERAVVGQRAREVDRLLEDGRAMREERLMEEERVLREERLKEEETAREEEASEEVRARKEERLVEEGRLMRKERPSEEKEASEVQAKEEERLVEEGRAKGKKEGRAGDGERVREEERVRMEGERGERVKEAESERREDESEVGEEWRVTEGEGQPRPAAGGQEGLRRVFAEPGEPWERSRLGTGRLRGAERTVSLMWSAVGLAVESLIARLGAELEAGRAPEEERRAVTADQHPEEPDAGRVPPPAEAEAEAGERRKKRAGSAQSRPGQRALSEEELQAYGELFLLFSEPPEHRAVSARSLGAALRSAGPPLAGRPLLRLLRLMDSDADGAVGFADFLRFAGDAGLYLSYVAQLPGCRAADPALFYRLLAEALRLGRLSAPSAGLLLRYYRRHTPAAAGSEARRGGAASATFMGVSGQRLALYLDAGGPGEGPADGPLSREQVSAFREFYDLFARNGRGRLDGASVLGMAGSLRLSAGHPLVPVPLQALAAGHGDGLSFPDFLRLMTDAEAFQRFLGREGGAASPQPPCREALSPDALFFDAVADIVRGPRLSAKAAGALVGYYHRAFREAVCQSRSRPPGRGSPAAGTGRRRPSRLGRLQAYRHLFGKALRNPLFVLVFNEYSWTWTREEREWVRRLDRPKKRSHTAN